MNKIITLTGAVIVICTLWMRIGSYYDGLAFAKSWMYAMTLVPITLLSMLVFLTCSVAIVISILRKRRSVSSLSLPLVVAILFIGSQCIPMPTFLDGLHDAVKSKLQRDRLLELARTTRQFNVEWTYHEEHRKWISTLRETFPLELSLNNIPPRIEVSNDQVAVFYGSGLTKHWGYAIVEQDECPLKHIPENLCRKVFDNVWVYQDIW